MVAWMEFGPLTVAEGSLAWKHGGGIEGTKRHTLRTGLRCRMAEAVVLHLVSIWFWFMLQREWSGILIEKERELRLSLAPAWARATSKHLGQRQCVQLGMVLSNAEGATHIGIEREGEDEGGSIGGEFNWKNLTMNAELGHLPRLAKQGVGSKEATTSENWSNWYREFQANSRGGSSQSTRGRELEESRGSFESASSRESSQRLRSSN